MVLPTAGSHKQWHSQPLLKLWGSSFHPETKGTGVRTKQVCINKAFTAYCWAKKYRMNPAGPKTTKRLYLKRCFIVLLMIQHIYSSKYLYWLLNIANVQFKFTCQSAAALSEYSGHRSSKNPTVPTRSSWRHWILHCILNSVCHISNADVHSTIYKTAEKLCSHVIARYIGCYYGFAKNKLFMMTKNCNIM